jgi:hypothetical protein
MKRILFLCAIFQLGYLEICAQISGAVSYSGIFKTQQDFKDGKLSFRINCDSSSGNIRLHNFFSRKYVSVIQNGKENKLSKDSIFGYRDCKGIDYRFHKNYEYEYQIIEDKSIVIYSALLQDHAYTGKGIKMVIAYFFSKTLDSDILPLTVANLKQVFPGDARLCALSDNDMAAYDDIHKMYKINYLLTQPVTNNRQTP